MIGWLKKAFSRRRPIEFDPEPVKSSEVEQPSRRIPAGRLRAAAALAAASPSRPDPLQMVGEKPLHYLAMPKPMPGMIPDGAELAFDAAGAEVNIQSAWNYAQAQTWNGQGFMGPAVLAELSQIPEFRKPCQIIADEMCREWIEITSRGDGDNAKVIEELTGDLEKFRVREVFHEAFDKEAQFGRMQIFICCGKNKGDELKTPFTPKSKVETGSLKYFKAIEPYWTFPNSYDTVNPLAENYYKPASWFVFGQEVHESRLLLLVSVPVGQILLPTYQFGGMPLIQMLYKNVRNWLRTRDSVGNITHNFSTPVFGTDLSKLGEPGGEAAILELAEFYNMFRDNQSLMFRDKDDESFEIVAAPLGSLDKLQAQAQEHMASTAQIPLIKYFGITPTGLTATSEGEIAVFDDTIRSRQERIGTPALKVVLECLQMNRYGKIDPTIGFVWCPLRQATPKEAAEINKLKAETDAALIEAGEIHPEEGRTRLAADKESGYSSIKVDDVPEQPVGPGAEGNPMDEHQEDAERQAA